MNIKRHIPFILLIIWLSIGIILLPTPYRQWFADEGIWLWLCTMILGFIIYGYIHICKLDDEEKKRRDERFKETTEC